MAVPTLLTFFLFLAQVASAQNVLDVLSKNCFTCHGPLIKSPRGGLSMASGESLKKGGGRGPAIVPFGGRSSAPAAVD